MVRTTLPSCSDTHWKLLSQCPPVSRKAVPMDVCRMPKHPECTSACPVNGAPMRRAIDGSPTPKKGSCCEQ